MRKLLGAIFAALLLAACDGSDMVDSGAGKEDVEFAKSVFEMVRSGDAESIKPILAPGIVHELEPVIAQFGEKFPHREAERVEVHTYLRSVGNDEERVTVALIYHYADSLLVFGAKFDKQDGKRIIETLQFNYRTAEDLAFHDFTLENKGILHYAFLSLLAATALFIFVTFIMCLRVPLRLTQKLVWSVFILVAAGQVTFIWTDGTVSANPFALSFFGISFVQSPLGPWIFKWGFPLGATIFHFRLRRAKEKVAVAEASGVVLSLEAAFGSDGGGDGGDGGGGDGGD